MEINKKSFKVHTFTLKKTEVVGTPYPTHEPTVTEQNFKIQILYDKHYLTVALHPHQKVFRSYQDEPIKDVHN